MSEKELIEELLTITEATEGGKVTFTERSKEILEELSGKYKKLPVYAQTKAQTPDWVKEATAADIYLQLCERIINAPTTMHLICVPKILIPIIWEKLQSEEGKVYFKKTSATGTTQQFLEEMGKIEEWQQ